MRRLLLTALLAPAGCRGGPADGPADPRPAAEPVARWAPANPRSDGPTPPTGQTAADGLPGGYWHADSADRPRR